MWEKALLSRISFEAKQSCWPVTFPPAFGTAYSKRKLAYGQVEDHSCSSGRCSHRQQRFVTKTSSRILSLCHRCQSEHSHPPYKHVGLHRADRHPPDSCPGRAQRAPAAPLHCHVNRCGSFIAPDQAGPWEIELVSQRLPKDPGWCRSAHRQAPGGLLACSWEERGALGGSSGRCFTSLGLHSAACDQFFT